jgi:hypothetical protein
MASRHDTNEGTMATEAVASGEDALGEAAARGGRLDRFFRAAGRLPGASELWFLSVGVAVSAVVQSIIWADGDLPVGTLARDAVLAPVSAGVFPCLRGVPQPHRGRRLS